MRIAILPSADLSYESGSVIHAKRLLSYLLQRGHEVCLLASRDPLGLSEAERHCVHVDRSVLEHPVIDDRPIADAQVADSLARSLRFLADCHTEAPIDVVHAQHLAFTSMAAAAFGAATRTPVVVSSFGRDLSIGLPTDPRLAAMARLSLHGLAHLIAPNESVLTELQRLQHEVGTKVPTTIVAPPLDPRVLEGHRSPNFPGWPLLATVNSCFTPEKGIDTIIRAFSSIRQRYPESALVIAGTDDHPRSENLRRLKALVEDFSLAEAVYFPGYLPRNEVGGLVAAADVFIDARIKGNFSSVILEAQFLHAAVVCSAVASAKLIVSDGVNGLLFPAGDWETLAEVVVALLASPERRAALRAECVRWCATCGKEYCEAEAMGRIEAIYEQVREHPRSTC